MSNQRRRSDRPRPLRWALRPLVGLGGAIALILGSASVWPASADTPADWNTPEPTTFDQLLWIILIPIAAALGISLLVWVGTLGSASRQREQAERRRQDPTWFGGPTKGIEQAEELDDHELSTAGQHTGGTSARW